MRRAAALLVALDADAGGRVVFGQAVHQQKRFPRFRADAHTVPGVEVVIQHTHVRDRGLDGDVVVAVSIQLCARSRSARTPGRCRRCSVGPYRSQQRLVDRRLKVHAPRGESVRVVDPDVEVGRVVQVDAGQNETVGMAGVQLLGVEVEIRRLGNVTGVLRGWDRG